MKSIKLKIAAWVIGLLCVVGSCIAQGDTTILLSRDTGEWTPASDWFTTMIDTPKGDTIRFKGETIRFEVGVIPEPMSFTLESEPLNKNEALQQMLELENEQTDALNQNLSNLNQIILDLPYVNVEAKLDLLDHYGIDPVEINRGYRLIHIIWYSMLAIFLVVYTGILVGRGKLYYSKKGRWFESITLVIGIILIGYILPKLVCYITIDNFYLWNSLGNLF